jgi:hypothetical protein
VTALAAGCTADGEEQRRPGDPVTQEEASALAGLLHRNLQRGGADFVVTAPFGDSSVLTLTGEIDFRQAVGRAQAVTSVAGRDDETRTLFFTPDQLWFGDVPGLAEALASAGEPAAAYLRRPLTTADDDEPPLVDVLVRMLLNLSHRTPDDPRSFLARDYTWEGQRSIDSRLASLFGMPDGATVAVAASGELLTQFATPLPGEDVEVTVTLSDHGRRALDVPADEDTTEAADHPGIAAELGL